MASVPSAGLRSGPREIKQLCAGYAALRTLLEQQLEAIQARDLGRLCHIVNAKERRVAELRRLHEILDTPDLDDQRPALVKFSDMLVQPTLAAPDVRRLVEPLTQVVEEMLALEQRSIRQLQQMQAEVQREIEQLARGRRTLKSYRAAPANAPPAFLQRCG
ncbi:MAG: hypothetical protein HYY96_05800 [Candidatus Tectomicrobia bacterium]|nr:hypothetical protein [Candidatus Tectomicrobia bacterium]